METVSVFTEREAYWSMTIEEVAKLAGVSKATVSRVLNNSGYVKEKTREAVERIVKEYHYVPMASAVSLSKQETNVIGMIVPEIDNMFYSDILRGVTEVADENDLSLVVFDTQNNAAKEARAMRTISQQRVKGLLMAPAVDYMTSTLGVELRKQLNALNIPVVIIDRDSENMPWDGVFYENYQSSYQAATEFIKAGHRKLSIITGDLGLKIGRDRLQGYRQSIIDHGLELLDEDIYEGNFLEDRAYELAMQIFARDTMPDAVYCCNNRTSLGFLKAAGKAGIKLGQDIGFIGNDRLTVLEQLGMPISCVYRDNFEQGRMALRMLLTRIENPNSPRNICMIPYSVYLCGTEKKTRTP